MTKLRRVTIVAPLRTAVGKFGGTLPSIPAGDLGAVPVPQRKGYPVLFDHDEGYRADATMESLVALRPLEGGVVTAGNASQQNDAGAACLVVAEDKLEELGLEPIAWFHS